MQRRELLRRSAAFFSVITAGSVLSACGGDDDAPATEPGPPEGSFRFDLGVASGDPRADSVVLWTRVQSSGNTQPDSIPLTLQVSLQEDFATLLVEQPLDASARYDHTVRTKIRQLQAATRYYYRFKAGSDVSATGISKTAPAADAQLSSLRFAWFTCQDWSVNHWGAME